VLDRELDPQRQLAFALDVVGRLGYDLERGRQDLSAHPFCVPLGPGDVRITTRVRRSARDSCLYSSIHESGHAMYNQGIPRRLARTPLWGGASPGVHESQSRLWENLVGRSRPFWSYFHPHFQAAFPDELGDTDPETFYRAVNRVQPSYVRVDADEVTYNLHVMLRFEIENELIEDRLRVEEIPEAWNARLQEYLGLPPPSAADGPLQDVHWSGAILGGFVGYSLGNVIGAQLMEAVRSEMPDLDDHLAAGHFDQLLGWLQERLYAHGRKFTPDELVRRATGRSIEAGPWIAHVRTKFGELYGFG
jgi:carboxypeptidase Taq